MNLPPFLPSDEAAWHEQVRRRELHRRASTLTTLAENIQLTEDFPSGAPQALAKLIGGTAKLLAKGLESGARAQDLEQINTVIGIVTSHLRYVERARVGQTPWSIIQSAERLLEEAVGANSHFIIRPTWAYNYSIIGDFLDAYRGFVSSWPWLSLADWKDQTGLKDDESIYCISFPRIERMNCLLHANWGHEVGHILVAKWVVSGFSSAWAEDEPGIRARIIENVEKNPPVTDPLFKTMAVQREVANQMRATLEAARQGFMELLCDLIGVHIFGLSALASTMEFAALFAMDVSPLQANNYPPWRHRLRMMLKHCEPDLTDQNGIGYPDDKIRALIEWLRSGYRLTGVGTDMDVINSNIVTREAYELISRHWDLAAQRVKSMLPNVLAKPYRLHEHHSHVAKLVSRLDQGVPPNEIGNLSGRPASFEDILTAAWAFKRNQIAKPEPWGSPDDYSLLFRLVLKACESGYVHARWGKRLQ